MTGSVIEIGPYQLILALVFVLGAGAASLYHGLRLEKDLLVGTIRTFVQLFILGYVLKFVFQLNSVWPVLFVFLFMIIFATRIIRSRIKEKQVAFFWPMLLSLIVSYALCALLITGVVVGAKPWWKPQYFIPPIRNAHRQFHERGGHFPGPAAGGPERKAPGGGNAVVHGRRLPGSGEAYGP